MSRVLALLLVVASLPLTAASGGSFSEDWSGLSSGWTTAPGFVRSCNEGGSCVLVVDPPCCEVHSSTSHALDIPFNERVALDFTFRALQEGGDSDTNIVLTLEDTFDLILHPTEGSNEGVSLILAGEEHRGFATRSDPMAWSQVRVILDASMGIVQAIVDGEASRPLPLPPGVDRITSIRIDGAQWDGSDLGVFHYGPLTVGPSNACFAPVVDLSAIQRSNSLTVDFAIVLPVECGAGVSWWLEFGDGDYVSGHGAPPASIAHTYPSRGYYHAEIATYENTTQRESWDSTLIDLRLTRTQVETGFIEVMTGATGSPIGDQGIIMLEQVAGYYDRVTLEHNAIGDVTIQMYATDGRHLGSCSPFVPSAYFSCLAPEGAAFARITGNAALGAWTFTYEYELVE